MLDTTMPLSLQMLSPEVLFSAFSEEDKPIDFSGTWMLNFEESEIEDTALIPEPVLVIAQLATSTETVRFNQTMALDGGNGQPMYCFMTQDWLAEQHTMKMVTKFSTDRKGEAAPEVTGTETWVLSDHGQTLTITNKMKLPDTAVQMKLVYNKQ